MLKRRLTRLRRKIRRRRNSRSGLLSSLPIEILDIIFEYLCLPGEPKQPILNLALTSRLFGIIARQYIPKVVEVVALSNDAKFTLFNRSVTNDLSYAGNVQSLIFQKLDEDKACDIPAEQIRKLLECLPRLKTLNLDGLPYDHIVPTLFSQPLVLKNNLKKLDIPGGLNVAEIAELLSFPAIRTWRFWKLDDWNCYSEFPKVDDIYLKELRFETCQIGLPLFKNTISRCRNLQILECNVPFQLPVKGGRGHEVDIETAFPAIELQAILANTKKTLKRLYLHSNNQTWLKWNDARLDLSDFSELKNINLSAMCVCAPLARDQPREGLYKLLPRCVEFFTLCFPPNIGLFYSTDDGKVIVEEYSRFLYNGVTSADSHWIHEFALHKATRLPHLQIVELKEDCTGPGNQNFGSHSWLQPSYLKSSYNEARIQLAVTLRQNVKG